MKKQDKNFQYFPEVGTSCFRKIKKRDKYFPEVVTLCGSTKFKKEYFEVMKRLTLEGKIVISVGLFLHADQEPLTKEQKEMLDELHLRKIDLSNSIYVIDPKGYVGDSTKREIKYAEKTNKGVKFYSKNE